MHVDKTGFLELAEGATVVDALKKMGIPEIRYQVMVPSINNKLEPQETALHDNDVLRIFIPTAGG
jgi:molybdopterin converting factor small subunit